MKQKHIALSALAAYLLQIATPAIAAGSCSVAALDTVAGLGTQISVTGCDAGVSTSLTMSGPGNTSYSQQIVLDASGNATTLIPSKYTVTAGAYQVAISGHSTTFNVIADRADTANSTLSVSSNAIRGDGQQTTTVTAVLRDKYDNAVAGRPLGLVSSRVSDDITPTFSETDDSGRFLWTVSATQAGQMTLIPYDMVSGAQLKLRADVLVSGGSSLGASLTGFERGGDLIAQELNIPIPTTAELSSTVVDEFELSLPLGATDVKANELFGMNIRAMRDGQVVRGYIGTLIVDSSDPDAEFPKKGEDPNSPTTGRIDMRSVDQGERNLALAFLLRNGGPQTIAVYDKSDPSIRGQITLNVLRDGGSADGRIVILDPKDRAHIKGHTVLLQGRAPSLVNLKVRGGEQIVNGESDTEGVFRISVDLNPQDKEVTLFVESENGTYESQPVHLIVDNEPPAIETISFDPAEGKAGGKARIFVKSEPELGTVVATLDGTAMPLSESGAGLYIASFTAPALDKIYDVTVQATDTVGNQSTMLTKWTVKPQHVPIVEGVTAESQPFQVTLNWKAVETMPITEYKIYIAKDSEPKNYIYSISTKQPVTSAVIKDLPLGVTYQFSLTAINTDGLESMEKSQPVKGTPIGMSLKVTPGKDSLLLEWTRIKDLPLDHYVLEYGVEPGAYTERRSVSGQATTTMLRDLIGGVTYYMRLTPVTITGKTMTDLAAVAQGVPGTTGFTPGNGEVVPPGMLDDLHPGAGVTPPPVPPVKQTPSSGLSTSMVAFALIATTVIGLFWRKYRKQQELLRAFMDSMQQRYHQS